jgi:hypothetical protein
VNQLLQQQHEAAPGQDNSGLLEMLIMVGAVSAARMPAGRPQQGMSRLLLGGVVPPCPCVACPC